jgi:alpha-L-rhamnosidase
MIERRQPVLWLVLGTILTTAPARADDLADRFRSPPDGARPWVYWMVMDGNFGPGGITEDLEAMKRVGISGLIFISGIPLELPASGSLFVLFRQPTDELGSQGRNFPEQRGVKQITGPWTVHFDPR